MPWYIAPGGAVVTPPPPSTRTAQIFFTSNNNAANGGVWVINTDGSGLTQIVPMPLNGVTNGVRFSTVHLVNGKVYFQFTGTAAQAGIYNNGANIGVCNLDGTGLTYSLTSAFAQQCGTFCSDGTLIYYSNNYGGFGGNIGTFPIAGGVHNDGAYVLATNFGFHPDFVVNGALFGIETNGTDIITMSLAQSGSSVATEIHSGAGVLANRTVTDGTHIFAGSGGTIFRWNLDGSGGVSIMNNGNNIQGLALSATSIYYTNQNNPSIGRANLDGSNSNQNYSSGWSATTSAPQGIAFG